MRSEVKVNVKVKALDLDFGLGYIIKLNVTKLHS